MVPQRFVLAEVWTDYVDIPERHLHERALTVLRVAGFATPEGAEQARALLASTGPSFPFTEINTEMPEIHRRREGWRVMSAEDFLEDPDAVLLRRYLPHQSGWVREVAL